MNDFFNTLGAAAKRAAGSVGIEVSIAAEEQKIKEAYQALGKLCYQAAKAGKEPAGIAFADQYRKIDASLKRIKELRDSKNVGDPYADEEDFEIVE